MIAKSGIVDETNATQPVAVVQLALTFDVVLTAHEVPHKVAPVHPVALVVNEKLHVLPESRFADGDGLTSVVAYTDVFSHYVTAWALAIALVHL